MNTVKKVRPCPESHPPPLNYTSLRYPKLLHTTTPAPPQTAKKTIHTRNESKYCNRNWRN